MTSLGSGEGGTREELKSQFSTREGTYRLASAVEFARTTRPLAYVAPSNSNTTPAPGTSPPVRISFVTHTHSQEVGDGGGVGGGRRNGGDHESWSNNGSHASNGEESNPDADATPHRFCLNIGKELFVYPYMGVRKPVDMSKPVDKRIYKGTNPTCHDFNSVMASHDSLMLLIGFSGGQIQLVDPISKEVNKLYNEERIIDKTRVTCIRWVPKSTTMFLVSHASGHVYLYNVDYPSGTQPPNYQVHKTGLGFTISNCKSKTLRNPLSRWTLGDGAINEFAFSPCGQYLAAVSQDGFLRIFRYDTYELVGITRSYFGGLLCVCWSPDGKYVCVGGEDDLVTMWSFKERRVVARGQGHKSWVSVVAFDPVTSTYLENDDSEEVNGVLECSCGHGKCSSSNNDCQSSGVFSCDSVETEQTSSAASGKQSSVNHLNNCNSSTSAMTNNQHTCTPNFPRHSRHSRAADSMRLSISEASSRVPVCYRVGSIGQDTQFCLWDLTEDVLKQPFGKNRPTSRTPGKSNSDTPNCAMHSNSNPKLPKSNNLPNNSVLNHNCTSLDDVGNIGGSGTVNTNPASTPISSTSVTVNASSSSAATNGNVSSNNSSSSSGVSHGLLSRFGALGFGSGGGDKDKDKDKEKNKEGKEHKRNFSLGSSSNKFEKNSNTTKTNSGPNSGLVALGLNIDKVDDPYKLIGTQACPRLDECPLLEPLICKKVSHERLTALMFREESIVTACQDGILCTWARPGDAVSQL